MAQAAPLKARGTPRSHTLLPRSHSYNALSRPQVCCVCCQVGLERAGRQPAVCRHPTLAPSNVLALPPSRTLHRHPAQASLLSADGMWDRVQRGRPMRNALLLLLSLILAANCVWAVQGLAAWRRGRLGGGAGGEQIMLQRLNATVLSVEVRGFGWSWIREERRYLARVSVVPRPGAAAGQKLLCRVGCLLSFSVWMRQRGRFMWRLCAQLHSNPTSRLVCLLPTPNTFTQVSRVGEGNATERSMYRVSAQLADRSSGSSSGGVEGSVASPEERTAVVLPGGEQHGKQAGAASAAAAAGVALAAGGNDTAAHGQDLVSQLKGMGSSLGSALVAATDSVLGGSGDSGSSSGSGSSSNSTGTQGLPANATSDATSPPPPPPPHRCAWDPPVQC